VNDDAFIMPIHPRFAEAILGGTKEYELRRVMPRVEAGQTVYIYATSPISSIVGAFTAGEQCSGSLVSLWRRLGSMCGVTRSEFEQYFSGLEKASALQVSAARALRRPTPLDELSTVAGGNFAAPQSTMRIRNPDLKRHLKKLDRSR